MKVAFRDGVQEVPDHVGALLRDHKILTLEITWQQALDQLNLQNERHLVNREADKIINAHLKVYG